ncbi:sarcosine oxidase subunit delta [Bordetella pertussis]|uniref:Sarcosine oxidase delta subunit n=9 Tax=Bordetella TaxID=517 RepID=Q7VVW8_BORPE|nr:MULTISPECIES: sarcosine oxidase subunit delta [Bordetella]ETH37798.1 sarcosine oxidase, delta subunit family protein [Bordetella pertussis H918]ETH45093.1 sarcosine oxidase, delta subunit family protein [Bordetella pertussis H939]ETH47096.1 sarcosine oxidase, delta subunit family protein [Bordetella pertussis H921]ETH69520.1 sarcosine oxidase, delta subunit family protein [Bordetella pertussis STO1-CHLA-0011]ETH82782.1 sarcosine oxidase, delta subunit family protein [Bordetella pertussis ST
MLRLDCPFCGVRSHTEFSYLGDATKTRPADDAPIESWLDFVYIRRNPKGRHEEYWQHVLGCRAWVRVTRDTLTHAIENVDLTAPIEEPAK